MFVSLFPTEKKIACMHARPRTLFPIPKKHTGRPPLSLSLVLSQRRRNIPPQPKQPGKVVSFSRASPLCRRLPSMSSNTPQQGSVSTNSSATKTVTSSEARGQRDARIQTFLSDQSLRLVHGTVTTQQRSSSLAAAAVADIDHLGLGSSGAGAGGAVGQPVDAVPLALRGTGSQFGN
ncbi:uncharacterized protein LY79DRAFT_559328 [Colletotrichum navitas]|uniref:Uncharacterized protein n=1 Tax=Colletotrichum navitas TaxID=681940 RepID=A0AAD8PVU5_9PEZI|nr:uncharacterized protein LY79DRAFT_559328 [Colletotrichum navitas]KAK1585148.1 hypothetical protein LY79DRAFT_559328 [Colletotrichum navitas]